MIQVHFSELVSRRTTPSVGRHWGAKMYQARKASPVASDQLAASTPALGATKHFRVSCEHFRAYANNAAELYLNTERAAEKSILSHLSAISNIYAEKAYTIMNLTDVLEHLVGKRFGPWGVALSGYYLKQTTDDEIDGRTLEAFDGFWSEGRKGQVFAIGPTVSYTTKSGVHLTAQWNHETEAENRFEGDKFILKLIMPL